MRNSSLRRPSACVTAAVVSLFVLNMSPATAQSPRSTQARIVPTTATVAGLTYGEWSALWWKWALEQTAEDSPLTDVTGANCAIEQNEKVWFLAGASSGDFDRSCAISPGTHIFFPVANAFCAAEGDFAEMRACASAFLAGATFTATIDGVSITNLEQYRALSPEFELDLPDGNIFGVPAGVYAPAAADGFYLMVNPLPPGEHTINFTASFATGDSLNVTYILTVE